MVHLCTYPRGQNVEAATMDFAVGSRIPDGVQAIKASRLGEQYLLIYHRSLIYHRGQESSLISVAGWN